MKVFREMADKAYATFTEKGVYTTRKYSVERSRMDLVISILKGYHADVFLDIGCGEGAYITKMQSYYKLLIGLDFCKTALLDLKKQTGKAENINCILADAHKLPIRNDSVDLVLCSEVLEHTENARARACTQFSLKSSRLLKFQILALCGFQRFLESMKWSKITEHAHVNYSCTRASSSLEG